MIMPRLVFATLLMAGLALSACGSTPELRAVGFTELGSDLRALASRRAAPATTLRPTTGFPGLDPALVAGQTVPMMGAYLEDRHALAGLVAVETNGGVVSWRTADNIGLSMSQSGLLIATRGLGEDLHAADINQTAALIASGRSGTVQRRHVYLDGLFRPVPVDLTCTLVPAGTETLVLNNRSLRTIRFDESCRNGDTMITNRYWRDSAGPLIRQSSQWVGSEIGMVHLQRLIE